MAAALFGAWDGGGTAGEALEPRVTTRTVTIPAAAFQPLDDSVDFTRGVGELRVDSGTGVFLAPVVFAAIDSRVATECLGADGAPVGPETAVVRVALAGICNTDLELTKGYMGFRGVLGHEFVGTVAEGPAAWRGRRVVGEINVACGGCETCARGLRRQTNATPQPVSAAIIVTCSPEMESR